LIPKEDRQYYLKEIDKECLKNGYKEYYVINFEPYIRKTAVYLSKVCDFNRIDDIGQAGRAALVSVAGRVDETQHPAAITKFITRTLMGEMLTFIAEADGHVNIPKTQEYYDKSSVTSYKTNTIDFELIDQMSPESIMLMKEDSRWYEYIKEFRKNRIRYPDTLIWDKCMMSDVSTHDLSKQLEIPQQTISYRTKVLKRRFEKYLKGKET
jgi:hypothetical protein